MVLKSTFIPVRLVCLACCHFLQGYKICKLSNEYEASLTQHKVLHLQIECWVGMFEPVLCEQLCIWEIGTLCNRGYAFGLWLSLPSRTFGPFVRLRHIQGLVWLLKDRFPENRLYMLTNCSNHVEAIKTTLSSLCRWSIPFRASGRLWNGLASQTRRSAAIIRRKEFADGPHPYTNRDINNNNFI